MIAHIETFLGFYSGDWKNLALLGVAMVSAISVLIGILKPLLFDKIKWKPLRRSCLAFTNIFLCFVAVAITFLFKHFDFSIYFHCAVAVSLLSIVTYWFYENTCLRDGIQKLGRFVLKKVYKVVSNLFDKDNAEQIEVEVALAVEEIKQKAKKELKLSAKNNKTDKELKNL